MLRSGLNPTFCMLHTGLNPERNICTFWPKRLSSNQVSCPKVCHPKSLSSKRLSPKRLWSKCHCCPKSLSSKTSVVQSGCSSNRVCRPIGSVVQSGLSSKTSVVQLSLSSKKLSSKRQSSKLCHPKNCCPTSFASPIKTWVLLSLIT